MKIGLVRWQHGSGRIVEPARCARRSAAASQAERQRTWRGMVVWQMLMVVWRWSYVRLWLETGCLSFPGYIPASWKTASRTVWSGSRDGGYSKAPNCFMASARSSAVIPFSSSATRASSR